MDGIRKGHTDTFCQYPANEGATRTRRAHDVKTCKHFCNAADHWCVWLQGTCDYSSDLCVYEYNKYWRSRIDTKPIQLTLF